MVYHTNSIYGTERKEKERKNSRAAEVDKEIMLISYAHTLYVYENKYLKFVRSYGRHVSSECMPFFLFLHLILGGAGWCAAERASNRTGEEKKERYEHQKLDEQDNDEKRKTKHIAGAK